MQIHITYAFAALLGLVAACDREPDSRAGTQVDPKQAEQHRDFQQQGDEKGPTGPDTQPKTGG